MIVLVTVICLCELCFASNLKNCYDDLGCFSNDYPWFSPLRPFPPPASPAVLNLKMYLCTRKNPNYKQTIVLRPHIYIPPTADFQRQRRINVFIIHGFLNNGNFTWIEKMKNAYLKRRDAHVFMLDWGNRAITLDYFQAASDTRVVGAELARFLKYAVKNFEMNLKQVHLIGHSLGAHIAGYCGKVLNGRIGRITGLDPAQPGFEDIDPKVRLDRSDAQFVEALHTDARPFVSLGFGMILPIGDVDVYANGGIIQPGCPINIDILNLNIKKVEDFGKLNVFTIASLLSCSHLRAFEYYIEALESDCIMWARMANMEKNNLKIASGVVIPIAPVTSLSQQCSIQTCLPLGIDLPQFPARGIFSLKTRALSPYCIQEADTTKYMFDAKRRLTSLDFLTEFLFPKRHIKYNAST